MPPRAPHSSIREYIPVDLVQLPAASSQVAAAPVAAPALTKRTAPKIVKVTAAPSPAPIVRNVTAVPASHAAPVTGPALPERTAATPATPAAATPGKEHQGGSGSSPSASHRGTGTSPSGKRNKGDYLAFYRLSRLPSFRLRSEPVYPGQERMTGSEARVLVQIYLDEHGAVDDVVIKKSGGKLFDTAVIDAVRQSSFHPGYMGDKAVPTVIQIPYTFKLK